MSTVDASEVHALVGSIHARPEDLLDGDLGHRLEKFTRYVRGRLKLDEIDLDEWLLDNRAVDELAVLPPETRPPVVYDAVAGSMIDGLHRANAAFRTGHSEIEAFIGIEANLDPDWLEDPGGPDP